MAEAGAPLTSAELAGRLGTDGAVVRRAMGGLRRAGIVRSSKGHGGGWEVARPLATVTLAEVYDALGRPRLFALGFEGVEPGCLIEVEVNRALGAVLDEAERIVTARLAQVSLAEVLRRATAARKGWTDA